MADFTAIELFLLLIGAMAVGYLISYTLDYRDALIEKAVIEEQLQKVLAENVRLTEKNTYLSARVNRRHAGGYFSRTA